jgi:putative spermidine/putrescine transport system permease protein
VSQTASAPTSPPIPSGAPPRRFTWELLGVLPFFLFAFFFLILPTTFLIVGGFQDAEGRFTLGNIRDLSHPTILKAYWISIQVSTASAIGGAVIGFFLAYAAISGGLPRWVRPTLMTFSGVASNFAGVPLALAFIFTLGQLGMVTVFLKNFGIDPYASGFTIYSKLGLELVYLYFQFPLMVLIIAPAIDGLRPEWREAAENMGASSRQYWQRVALPILFPTLLGTMILLFGNAFGAQATAYQLTSGLIPLVPLLIGNQIAGDVLHNPGLGYAMAMGMVAVMGASIAVYTVLQRRAERWRR